jgi:acetylornithine deacetylase
VNKYEILEKLVSINTIKDLGNSEIVEYIAEILTGKGFKVELIGGKNNKKCLIAKSKKECEIAFLGHSDTVSYSDGWITNPFELVQKDSKLFGLGVCDMKGGIAAFLEAINNISIEKLSKGVMVMITFDEEIGFEGVKLIKDRKDIPKTIIVGEPTNNEVIISSKGCMEFEVTFKGKTVHSSSMVLGDNAILKCMRFIDELTILANSLKNDTNEKFSTQYTTNNISIIEGGDCINKVPDKCKLLFDFRTVYESHNEIILTEVENLVTKYNAHSKLITNIKPFNCSNKNKLKIIENILNAKTVGANFVTDGNFFEKRDIFIIGPGPLTAHQENEYIEVASFEKTIVTYQKIIEQFCK